MGTENHIFDVYNSAGPEFVRGKDARLFTGDGKEYLDCTSGIAVNALGHGHPRLVEALKNAADGIWHLSNVFSIPGQTKLARMLCENTFAEKVFFTNSGAEAMECAIKTARRFHYHKGNAGRVNIITFEGAFHGRTIATIAAGGQEKYLKGFGEKAPGFISVPFGDLAALKATIDNNTAAILFEPIQGEGGVREIPDGFMRSVRDLCDAHGILMMLDEVQTGVGRTGKLFAYQWDDAEPDLMAIAKGIGGGFPLGACLATREVACGMEPGTHGSTYGGNPLAMAVGCEVLEVVLEEGFLEAVQGKTIRFRQITAEIIDNFPDLVESVSGKGLLIGIKAKIPNSQIVQAFHDQGLLVLVAGDNVVRIAPPLIISDEQIAAARQKMIAGLKAIQTLQTE